MLRYSAILFFCVSVFLWSCEDKEKEETCAFVPDTENITLDFKFESLTDSFVNVPSKKKLVALLGKYPVLRDQAFQRQAYPNDSAFINNLYERFNNPHIDTLRMEVTRVFGDENALRTEFEQAFKNLRYYYPQAIVPKVQTVVTGLETDIVMTDSLIIIGLDYYLGPGAKYRANMYEYLLRQYVKENIVPTCMLLYGIDTKYNVTNPADKTVLADMVAYGKAYYFAKQMVPCTPDSVFIWYTAEEIQGARENQDLIWARLIEDQVLYSTSHVVKQKFLGERPKTIEVGDKCPGRIAQWVGWEIVKSYMKSNDNISLPELMHYENADKLFKESKYRPIKK